jgi:hypothetical protein
MKQAMEKFREQMRERVQARAPGRGPGGPPARGADAHRERFKAADKNDDGKLSKEEAPGPLKEHFEKIDADKDGQLTPEEIRKAFEEMRNRRRG